jgi:hypothetical protein
MPILILEPPPLPPPMVKIERQTMELLAVEKDGSVFVEGHINNKPFSYTRELHPFKNNVNNDKKANKFRHTNNKSLLSRKNKKSRTLEKKKRLRRLTKRVRSNG